MEKTIDIQNTEIKFSIWDLGGQKQYMEMMLLVCNEAVALLFLFDLTRPATLASIRQWYMAARKLNKKAIPFLIGTKFDKFSAMQLKHKQEMTKQARKPAKAMHASLIFSSAARGINIAKIFKIVLAKAFRLKCRIPQVTRIGEPILEYEAAARKLPQQARKPAQAQSSRAAAGDSKNSLRTRNSDGVHVRWRKAKGVDTASPFNARGAVVTTKSSCSLTATVYVKMRDQFE